ncbi:hypothetical protein [Haladaptatus sp. NG-SE-30]
MAGEASENDESPSTLIDARIKELLDWQGETLSRMRGRIKETDPDVVEGFLRVNAVEDVNRYY